MKICVAGAGAIGGFLAAKLALTGWHEVSVLARGDTYKALHSHGLTLHQAGQVLHADVVAHDNPHMLGVQDILLIAVKAQSLPELAPTLAPLIGSHTLIVPAMNGVPWWFLNGLPSVNTSPLSSVDPTGAIARALPMDQVLGCVIHGSMASPKPGIVVHNIGQGVMVGEPFQATISARVQSVVDIFKHANLDASAQTHIRRDIWYKLWGNLSTNPVAAITGATVDKLLDDIQLRTFCSAMMLEAQEIGSRIDCAINQTPEDRHSITRKLGAFKPSMLQDVEAGRSIELDAIVASVVELGQRVGVDTPYVSAMLGLMRVFARQHGLYPN